MLNYEIQKELNSLKIKLEAVTEKLNKIPMPFKFMYKPPGKDVHWNLVEYLDSIDARLRKLEDGNNNNS